MTFCKCKERQYLIEEHREKIKNLQSNTENNTSSLHKKISINKYSKNKNYKKNRK
jgi:hypothetical protein